MKKNLLTLMFVIAFVCVGVSVANAKNSSSPANSVAVSKKLAVAKNISSKIKALKAKCEVSGDCSGRLTDLLFWNSLYEYSCAPNYATSCSPILANMLIGAGAMYEFCLNADASVFKSIDKTTARNRGIDRNLARNKTEKPRDLTSGE